MTVLIVRADVDVGCRREKTGVGFPHGARGETLKEIEQRLEMSKPDESHGPRVRGPEELDRMAVKEGHHKAQATAEDGVIELGRFEPLVYIHGSKPCKDEMGQRLHLQTSEPFSGEKGRMGSIRA